MAVSVYKYRTKFIQDIVEPVSLQILNLIETCERATSPNELPDLVPSTESVANAIEQLSKTGESTKEKTSDTHLKEDLQKMIPILLSSKEDLKRSAIMLKEDCTFKEGVGLLSSSCKGILNETLNMLLSLDDNSLRIMCQCINNIRTELTAGTVLEGKETFLFHLKKLMPMIPKLNSHLDKRTENLLNKDLSNLIEVSKNHLREDLKFYINICKKYMLSSEDDRTSLSIIMAIPVLCMDVTLMKTEEFILKNDTTDVELSFESRKLSSIELKTFYNQYNGDPNERLPTVFDKIISILKQLEQTEKNYIADNRRDLNNNLNFIVENINNLNRASFKNIFYGLIQKIQLSNKSQTINQDIIKLASSLPFDESMTYVKFSNELTNIITHIKHSTACFCIKLFRQFNQHMQKLETCISQQSFEENFWANYSNRLLENLLIVSMLGALSYMDNIRVDITNIKLYFVVGCLIKFMKSCNYESKHYTECRDMICSLAKFYHTEYETEYQGWLANQLEPKIAFATINDCLNRLEVSIKEKDIQKFKVEMQNCIDHAYELMKLENLDPKTKGFLANIVTSFEAQLSTNNLSNAEQNNKTLSNIQQMRDQLREAELPFALKYPTAEENLDDSKSLHEDKKNENKNKKSIAEMEMEAAEAAIPDEYEHVKETILNPDENDRIAIAASELHKQIVNTQSVSDDQSGSLHPGSLIAFLFAELSNCVKQNKPGAIDIAKKISAEAMKILKQSNSYLNINDSFLRRKLETHLNKIPTLATQLKIISGVKSTYNKVQPNSKDEMEANETLFICSENIMNAVKGIFSTLDALKEVTDGKRRVKTKK